MPGFGGLRREVRAPAHAAAEIGELVAVRAGHGLDGLCDEAEGGDACIHLQCGSPSNTRGFAWVYTTPRIDCIVLDPNPRGQCSSKTDRTAQVSGPTERYCSRPDRRCSGDQRSRGHDAAALPVSAGGGVQWLRKHQRCWEFCLQGAVIADRPSLTSNPSAYTRIPLPGPSAVPKAPRCQSPEPHDPHRPPSSPPPPRPAR